VRHEQHCPWEGVECPLELLDRRHVKVVRGLVENETVHAARNKEGDQRACALARGQRACVAQDVVCAEAELREQCARAFLVHTAGLRERR